MSTSPAPQSSRFKAPSNLSTSERISTNTVGLVALSDFRKRRAQVLEDQEREAREALRTASGASTPKLDHGEGVSRSATPANEDGATGPRKKAKKAKKALVSFGDDDGGDGGDENNVNGGGDDDNNDEDEDDGSAPVVRLASKKTANGSAPRGGRAAAAPAPASPPPPPPPPPGTGAGTGRDSAKRPSNIAANAAVGIVPRAMTKAALRREAEERDTLRKEFLALQEAVKNTEIAIPFVFYDGANTPGGIVRVRKGEFVWVFLDNCRKVGAQRGVGGGRRAHVRKQWARIGVDDMLLIRGTMIIPHHYEFYFFIMNKTIGPGNVRLFNYSAEAPLSAASSPGAKDGSQVPNPLSSAKGGIVSTRKVDIKTLEGADEDPTFTKVVDRRWYERNKHIYPASMWQQFDPEKDYTGEIRRDTGGNTFFFSK